ncbi:hypothetical protein AQUCO_00200150v1 [Aquilegia coerulea]|uniref:Dof zinc finger protein n=1 Tax=Aquilegia coerulea TaxID=218851 RepID=A0A2G5F1Q2_AQUCA|nr:hypothetical protein AQUCO_00200150v1 [Aquilegia coerulea]
MGFTSLQTCMDTSDQWLHHQGTASEERRMESSPPLGDMITCSRPMSEKKLRPQHDQALKCPRCDSSHTKFCYYNNYSLSQPRYFCKTCRRYWTKGGSLRNIPVGGGCRKNKRVSVKKSSDDQSLNPQLSSSSHDGTDLQLSFPHEVQLSHLNTFLANNGDLGNSNFLENKYNSMLENHRQFEFMESKFGNLMGNHRNHDFMSTDLGLVSGLSHANHELTSNFHDQFSHYGISFNGTNGNIMDTCQRLMLPFDGSEDPNAIEMKPNKQLLSLDWQDQGCSEVGKESFAYYNGMGSWNGLMNGYGSSTTNPLV